MEVTLEPQVQKDAVPDKLQGEDMKMNLAPISIAKPSRTKAGFDKSAFHAHKPTLTSFFSRQNRH